MVERALVYVEWMDSRGVSASWEHLETLQENDLCIIRSVGWLLREESDFIQIVPHLGIDPDQGCGDMTIPVSQISRRIVLDIPAEQTRLHKAASKVLRDSSRSKRNKAAAGLDISQGGGEN